MSPTEAAAWTGATRWALSAGAVGVEEIGDAGGVALLNGSDEVVVHGRSFYVLRGTSAPVGAHSVRPTPHDRRAHAVRPYRSRRRFAARGRKLCTTVAHGAQ